jgi:fumarate reductase subunit D
MRMSLALTLPRLQHQSTAVYALCRFCQSMVAYIILLTMVSLQLFMGHRYVE